MNRTIKSQFVPALESLRGIASFSVLLGHAYVLSFVPGVVIGRGAGLEWLQPIASALFDPQPAVLLFFVLSGYVLGFQLDKDPVSSARTYIAYMVRRTFRLVPVMWLSFVFAFALFMLSTLFDASSSARIGVETGYFLHSFFLQDFRTNIVTWSLYVEIIGSALIPLLFLVAGRFGVALNLILFSVLFTLSIFVRTPLAVQFLVFFYAGLLIGYAPKWLDRAVAGKLGIALGIAAVILYFGAKQLVPWAVDWTYGRWQHWQWLEVGACVTIVYLISIKRFASVEYILSSRVARFMGRISFSLYLLHLPILYFFLKAMKFYGVSISADSTTFDRAIIFLAAAVTVSVIVIPLSSVTYRLVELPGADMGRRWARTIGELKCLQQRSHA